MEQINTLMQKFNHFKDAQFYSLQKPADSTLLVTLIVQNDDGEDTDKVEIEFSNIHDARLLENSMLGFLDMMSGVSIIKEHNLYGFAIGSCDAMLHVQNAPLYIVSSDIKIEESAV